MFDQLEQKIIEKKTRLQQLRQDDESGRDAKRTLFDRENTQFWNAFEVVMKEPWLLRCILSSNVTVDLKGMIDALLTDTTAYRLTAKTLYTMTNNASNSLKSIP